MCLFCFLLPARMSNLPLTFFQSHPPLSFLPPLSAIAEEKVAYMQSTDQYLTIMAQVKLQITQYCIYDCEFIGLFNLRAGWLTRCLLERNVFNLWFGKWSVLVWEMVRDRPRREGLIPFLIMTNETVVLRQYEFVTWGLNRLLDVYYDF